MVKIVGVGAAAFGARPGRRRRAGPPARRRAAAAGRLVNVVLGAGVIAGTANLVNLLDLRPGRALKAGTLIVAPLLAGGRAGGLVAGPAGAAAGLLPADLDEEIMLGDAGANALRRAARPGRRTRTGADGARPALLAGIAALTAASEKVSFTKVIESTPGLRELDALGRRSDHVATRASERPRFLG